MKNLKRNMVIAAMGIVVAGGSFFAGSYFSNPVASAQSVNEQASQSQQEVESPPIEVKILQQESSVSSSSAVSEEGAANNPPAVVQISKQPLPTASSAPTRIAPPTTSSAAAPAKATKVENAGTVFEGYTVTVTDKNTPAVMALGRDWPITKLYFLDANGDSLGSISGTAYSAIIDKYKTPDTWDAPGANGAWEFWFAEEFNAYRGITSSKSGGGTEHSNVGDPPDNEISTYDYAAEVVELTNAERRAAGLNELQISQDMMDLAQIRAEEIVSEFSHVRPDGVRISSLGYGENISKGRDTPNDVVTAWMNSDGHKANIMLSKYEYIGVGCYNDNGTYYWVQLFSWNE